MPDYQAIVLIQTKWSGWDNIKKHYQGYTNSSHCDLIIHYCLDVCVPKQ